MVWVQMYDDNTRKMYSVNTNKLLMVRQSNRGSDYTEVITEHLLPNGERKMTFRVPFEDITQLLQISPDPLNTYDSEGLGHVV